MSFLLLMFHLLMFHTNDSPLPGPPRGGANGLRRLTDAMP